MRFQTESELISVLTDALKSNYQRHSIEVFEEVSLGYGIADLVLSNLINSNEVVYKKRILRNAEINIYSLIKKSNKISIESISDITKNSKSQIKKSLNILLSNNYIKRVDDYFQIDIDYQLTFKENFAIEAKLKDWKRALNQAYRYKWFAEYSYVVMDEYHAKTAIKNIEFFEKYNVGLATINPEGDIKRYFNPKRQLPFDPKMQILFSEKIKSITSC